MKVFFDFEFDKNRFTGLYFPISLGAVREDGGEFYHVFEFRPEWCGEFVRTKVLPALKVEGVFLFDGTFEDFCAPDDPEFWANYGAYDWFLLCEQAGGLMRLPESWPSYYNELQMLRRIKGKEEPPELPSNAHNALADARWNKRLYEWCMS